MAVLHDIFRQHLAVDLDFDWTDLTISAMLVDKTTWTPAESDSFVDDALGAGATETSGTRQTVTSTVAALSGHAVFFTADPIVYPGVLLGETFDTLVIYKFVTSDSDSYLIATYDLGAQTGDGNDVTITSDPSGYVKV